MNEKCKVIVIGAGASGIMAAIAAKRAGADVTLLDGNPIIGRKLAATGNGRCNFTNADADNTAHYYGENKDFINAVLSCFTVSDILSFFDDIGVTPNLEEDGKYFPLSGQASSVTELLQRCVYDNGINVMLDTKVQGLNLTGKNIDVVLNDGNISADRVIIATGGMASPDSGSNGSGYEFARKIGHTVNELMPIIVQLKTKGGFYKRMSGLRIYASVKLIAENKTIREACGDVMFFDYGLSGNAVFKISCDAAYQISYGKKVYAVIDVVPQYRKDELESYIRKRCSRLNVNVSEMLVGFINKKLIQSIIDASGVNEQKNVNEFNDAEIKALCNALKNWKLEIIGTKGWENAQATAGGIRTSEVNSCTLRSKIDSRVGFCGEILDVAGDCGGYNLSWAWASGFVCGSHICEGV